jgi:hypothetical protein
MANFKASMKIGNVEVKLGAFGLCAEGRTQGCVAKIAF